MNEGAPQFFFAYDEAGHQTGKYDGLGNPIWETAWLGDLPVAASSPVALFYIAPDHLGSPHQITGASGAVVWQWNHDPFGNGDPQGTFSYELRFPGQFFDQATRLHYNYFRDYDPRLGRYIESDPIGLAGGINTYAYGRNDPLGHIDPLGTQGTSSGAVEGEIGVGTDYGGYCSSRKDRKEECTEQWESDTSWCDRNFRGGRNVDCHEWANDELQRCLKGTPRQPFRR